MSPQDGPHVPSDEPRHRSAAPSLGQNCLLFAVALALLVVIVTAGTASAGRVSADGTAAGGTQTVHAEPAAVEAAGPEIVQGRGLHGSRWNPCRPISYLIEPQGGYDGSVADLRKAIQVVGAATGMTFVAATKEQGEPDVTVTWESPSTAPDLVGAVAARTRTTTVAHDGVLEIARATVRLDRTTSIRAGFATSGPADWGQVYLHELGHVVGLAHVPGRTEIMNRAVSPDNHVLAAGDLSRLHQVGRAAGCIPNGIR